jgi:RHS repeat-associated protein
MVETKTIDHSAILEEPNALIRFQHDNHLGSALLELDDQAAVITYEEYYPYGSTSFGATSSEVSKKRYRYTGKERDEETGFYYHGARYYAPWLGRWTACDPAQLMGGINYYEYAASNPIRLADPSGYGPDDLIDPAYVGTGPEYSYSAKSEVTGKYTKVSSDGPIQINGEEVKPPPKPAARAAAPASTPSSSSATPAAPKQTIKEKREQEWSAAKAGMWNGVVDLAELALGPTALSLKTATGIDPLGWARASGPAPTGDSRRDQELQEHYHAGGMVTQVVVAGASFGAGPLLEAAEVLAPAETLVPDAALSTEAALPAEVATPTEAVASPGTPAASRGVFNARNVSQGGNVNCSECVTNFEASAQAGTRVRAQIPGGGAPADLTEHMRRLTSVGANPRLLPLTYSNEFGVTSTMSKFPAGTRFSVWASRGSGQVGHVFAGQVEAGGVVRFLETQVQAPVGWSGYQSFLVVVH